MTSGQSDTVLGEWIERAVSAVSASLIDLIDTFQYHAMAINEDRIDFVSNWSMLRDFQS
jgi:hypothetical protein